MDHEPLEHRRCHRRGDVRNGVGVLALDIVAYVGQRLLSHFYNETGVMSVVAVVPFLLQ